MKVRPMRWLRGWVVYFQKCRKSTREQRGTFVMVDGDDKEVKYAIERSSGIRSREENSGESETIRKVA